MTLAVTMSLVIIAVILALSLKSRNPEISTLMSAGICIIIISISIDRLAAVTEMIERISEYISIDSVYLSVLLKLVGISYICEFASGISKDAGYSAVSSQIEMVGKLTMLVISMPVVISVIDKVVSLLG